MTCEGVSCSSDVLDDALFKRRVKLFVVQMTYQAVLCSNDVSSCALVI